ncbi:MFS transporter [Ruminococcaceae bacterium OttesenSCG-928-O06]|nr:MFS transporter [Ruminococcaceae bacterium OttesenSCG-928-O06]
MSEAKGQKAGALLQNLPYLLFLVFYWSSEALFVPYLGLYFGMRGMSSMQIGFLNSLFYVITILSAASIGYIADKTRRPRLVVTLCFTATLLVIVYMSRATSFLHLGAAYALYGYFTVSCCDLVDKLLLERLQGNTRYFGIFKVGSPLGYSAGVLLAGALIPRLGLTSLFPACMAFTFLCVVMALLMKESQSAGQVKHNKVPLRHLLTNKNSLYIYGVMALWGFSESGALNYLAIYMADKGFTTQYTSLLITIAMTGQTIAFFLMPTIQPVIRPKTMVMLGFIVLSGRVFSLALVAQLPFFVIALLHFLGGCAQAFVLTPITLMIGRSFEDAVSSSAQTMKTVANKGIGSSIGVLLFGWLYGFLPASGVMLAYACLILLFGLCSRLGRKSEENNDAAAMAAPAPIQEKTAPPNK